MWPLKLKLDEEKLKHAGLSQQKGFGPTVSDRLLRLAKVNGECYVSNITSKNGIGNKGHSWSDV
jgi:hypothetical protein